MTKPQLLAANGTVIFEFDDDKAMRVVLRNTIWQARHGRRPPLRVERLACARRSGLAVVWYLVYQGRRPTLCP